MSSAWKKPKYGPVKPVKQPKALKPLKPSVLELKAIFRSISTAGPELYIDILSSGCRWFQNAIPYIKLKRVHESLPQTRQLVAAFEWHQKAVTAEDKKEKEQCFIRSLDFYRGYAKTVIATPPIAPFVKEMRIHLVQSKDTNKRLDKRFDKLLTMLTQCFASMPFEFKVIGQCFSLLDKKPVPMKLDPVMQTLYLSRSLADTIAKNIRKDGLLPVVIDGAYQIARAMSLEGVREGNYIVNTAQHLANYKKLMHDIADYAANNPNAPKRLVKSKLPKKVKKSDG